jgi:glyoxylate reductase
MSAPVLVTQSLPEDWLSVLAEHCQIDISDSKWPIDRQELLISLAAKPYVGLLCLPTDRIDGPVLDAAGPRLRVVASASAGTDHLDVAAASERGIVLTNAPEALTETTADLAWALLLAAARRVIEGDQMIRSGEPWAWSAQLLLGLDVHGSTLGIVGAGRIGTAVARRARGFGMNLLYASRQDKSAMNELGAKHVPLEVLLGASDFVSLHTPITPETHHLIGSEALRRMKRSAVLINTARGSVVDETALVVALQDRQIAAAGLDVFENEPELSPGLTELDNVVLLPHIGSASVRTRSRMVQTASQGLIDALQDKSPQYLVNPNVWERRRIAQTV